MASDWIKSKDAAFREQAVKLIAIIASHQIVWGLTAEELIPLNQCKAIFDAALFEQAAQAAIYHAVVAQKQASGDRLERALRMMVRRINNHPGMTNALRQKIELATPTRSASDGNAGNNSYKETREEKGINYE